MTLQQLRYLIAISEHNSINAAAQSLYVSQSNLSTAIKELERELGITIFTRSNRGVALTNDGTELLGYARQVIEQADMMEERYARGMDAHRHLAVSTQHYYFSLQAFINVAERCASDAYDFVGSGANAVMRRMQHRELGADGAWTTNSYSYWSDAAHTNRHGKVRFVSGSGTAWSVPPRT